MTKCHECGKYSYEGRNAYRLVSAQYDTKGKLVYGVCEHGVKLDDKRSTPYDSSVASIPLALMIMERTV